MKRIRLLCLVILVGLAACQSVATPQVVKPAGPIATPLPSAASAPTPTVAELFAGTQVAPTTPEEKTMPVNTPDDTAFGMNTRLGRGVNLGNALEAPKEGDWGVKLEADYFKIIKDKGFDSVRVPIRWSAHAAEQAPYTIDPAFFDRIDWVVEQARANDLLVILNMHHYDQIFQDPAGNRERFLALWEQIAQHFQNAPDSVLFEPLNEPNSNLKADGWNKLVVDVLAKIRASNPKRYVVLGPVSWNSVDELDKLSLPQDDQRIIVTFHYYRPFEFTHQGAEWQAGSDKWLGTQWTTSEDQKAAVDKDLDKAARWSKKNNRPIYLGEFGAYSKADMDSRARWTSYVARQAEARGFSWSYWEFCSGFGVYDRDLKMYINKLVDALIPPG